MAHRQIPPKEPCQRVQVQETIPSGHDTALIQAAIQGHTEIALALIEAGADRDKVTKGGDTALDQAQRHERVAITRALSEPVVNEELTSTIAADVPPPPGGYVAPPLPLCVEELTRLARETLQRRNAARAARPIPFVAQSLGNTNLHAGAYLIRSADRQFSYVGATTDISRRLDEHDNHTGSKGADFTRCNGPGSWQLVYYWPTTYWGKVDEYDITTDDSALGREMQVKEQCEFWERYRKCVLPKCCGGIADDLAARFSAKLIRWSRTEGYEMRDSERNVLTDRPPSPLPSPHRTQSALAGATKVTWVSGQQQQHPPSPQSPPLPPALPSSPPSPPLQTPTLPPPPTNRILQLSAYTRRDLHRPGLGGLARPLEAETSMAKRRRKLPRGQ